MICPKCHYEFCWICMGYYPSYMHEDEMKHYHSTLALYKSINPSLMVIFIIMKLLYISNPSFSFKNTERVFDSLIKGQSIFTSYHILVTFLAWITIHLYLIIAAIIGFSLGYKIKRMLKIMNLNTKLVYLNVFAYVGILFFVF